VTNPTLGLAIPSTDILIFDSHVFRTLDAFLLRLMELVDDSQVLVVNVKDERRACCDVECRRCGQPWISIDIPRREIVLFDVFSK